MYEINSTSEVVQIWDIAGMAMLPACLHTDERDKGHIPQASFW